MTSVTLQEFCLGNFGMLPDQLTMCFVGSTLNKLKDLHTVDPTKKVIALVVILVCTAISTAGLVYIAYYARGEYDAMREEIESERLASSDAVDGGGGGGDSREQKQRAVDDEVEHTYEPTTAEMIGRKK